jgi:hypothetical protein
VLLPLLLKKILQLLNLKAKGKISMKGKLLCALRGETDASFNSLTLSQLNQPFNPERLRRRRAVSPLKIKIPSKNMREKPTNTPIIHSVY